MRDGNRGVGFGVGTFSAARLDADGNGPRSAPADRIAIPNWRGMAHIHFRAPGRSVIVPSIQPADL
jgi:hypothetical protein